jgi:methylmalonyl-CoA/ethylmalonyl-CoA epimerase
MTLSPLTCIHHLGICVRDLDGALATYRDRFGLTAAPDILTTAEIRGALLPVGSQWLEIFEPRQAEGTLVRFLERRGEGLHHVAYQVEHIDAALAELAARGARLVDQTPRPGLHPGWRIAFIHPSSGAGVLTELVEVGPPVNWSPA